MATFHCSVKVGGLGKGAPHAAYISREGKYEHLLHSEKAEKLEHIEHGNMPKWAEQNPMLFWQQADERERKGGAVYREFELALPNELTPDQSRELVQEFIRQEIGDKHPYSAAIHNGKAALDGAQNNRNAHIMFSERTLDGIERGADGFFKREAAAYRHRKTKELIQPDAAARAKGGCGKSDRFGGSYTERKETLRDLRERWATIQNKHLERHGHEARVDHRSLKEQGLDRTPEKHLGAKRVQSLGREQVADLLAARVAEGQRERAQREVSGLDLSGDLSRAVREVRAEDPPEKMREREREFAPNVGKPRQEENPFLLDAIKQATRKVGGDALKKAENAVAEGERKEKDLASSEQHFQKRLEEQGTLGRLIHGKENTGQARRLEVERRTVNQLKTDAGRDLAHVRGWLSQPEQRKAIENEARQIMEREQAAKARADAKALEQRQQREREQAAKQGMTHKERLEYDRAKEKGMSKEKDRGRGR